MSTLRPRTRSLLWPSAIWLVASIVFLALLAGHFYFAELVCYSDAGRGSPDGTTYLSLWPPGPGCSYVASDQPPSLVWLVSGLLLIVTGVLLMRAILVRRKAASQVRTGHQPLTSNGSDHG